MSNFASSDEFMQHLRERAIFSDEGYPSEALLAEMLKIAAEADPTRPEYALTYYRHEASDGTQSGIDAYSHRSDESARISDDDSDEPTQLLLIYFIASTSGEQGPVGTERLRAATDEIAGFYARCRLRSGLPRDIGEIGSDALLDLSEILREGRQTIDSIRLEIFTDLPIAPDFEYMKQRTLDGMPVKVDIWTPDRLLETWQAIQVGRSEDIVLKLSDDSAHPVLAVGSEEYPIFITALKGDQLAEFYGQHQLQAVNENVRAFLEFKGKTNKGIRETIKYRPERFMAYNNGLTIVASRIDADAVQICPHEDCEEGEHPAEDEMGWPWSARSLHDVQIVNGGQTTAAIYHCWKDGGMREQVEKLRVFAKIIVVGTGDHDEREELVSAIAKYSNTQNKVEPATLESNIPHFKSLAAAADSLSAPSGLRNGSTFWYFDRAPGRYIAQGHAEGGTWRQMHPADQVIDKYEIADIVNCADGRPHDAQKGRSGSFSAYRQLLKERNQVHHNTKDRTPRGLCLFGENAYRDRSEYDDYLEEWRGTVAAVIVLRRLKQLLDPETESWMRTISRRYVLAMAYEAFRPLWDRAWTYQSADEAYRHHWSAAWPSYPTFESWAQAALQHVVSAMRASARAHPGKGENQRGMMEETWTRALAGFKRSTR